MLVNFLALFDVHRNIYNGIQLESGLTDEGKVKNNCIPFSIYFDDDFSKQIMTDNVAYFDKKTESLYFGYYEKTRSSNSLVVFVATHKYAPDEYMIKDIEDIFIEESRII